MPAQTWRRNSGSMSRAASTILRQRLPLVRGQRGDVRADGPGAKRAVIGAGA